MCSKKNRYTLKGNVKNYMNDGFLRLLESVYSYLLRIFLKVFINNMKKIYVYEPKKNKYLNCTTVIYRGSIWLWFKIQQKPNFTVIVFHWTKRSSRSVKGINAIAPTIGR